MISYADALALLQQNATPLPAHSVPLTQALNHVASESIHSPIALPRFRNSTMDGFALRSALLEHATPHHPVTLAIQTAIAAGDIGVSGDAHQTVQIMTGAEVPAIYDAIIPVEAVVFDKTHAHFTQSVAKGTFVRSIGEDVGLGQLLLEKGQIISPEIIMLLAATGIETVKIFKQPALHIISTGNEISDDYQAPLKPAQIYNANAPYLLAAAQRQAIAASYEGLVGDDPQIFAQKFTSIQQQPGTNIILSTGAVSRGEWDFIPDTLKQMGAEIIFHRVNIRPGKPVLFARLPNGNYYLGLPGNPISSVIGFNFFLMPLIRAMQGKTEPMPLKARLAQDFIKQSDFCQFLKARLGANIDGHLIADIADGQESFKISPLASSNAWVILDGEKRDWKAGDLVSVLPLNSTHHAINTI